MLNKRGLDKFKKAQAAEPFSVNAGTPQSQVSLQRPSLKPEPQQQSQQGFAVPKVAAPAQSACAAGGGASSWQAPEWAVEPKPGSVWLDVVKDGSVLDKIPMERRRTIFGRQAVMCDYILDHPSVSRQHAAVVQHKNGSIYVIDLGSVHGTFVANERLTKDLPVELEAGQSLRFAASTRSYVLRKASAPVQKDEPPAGSTQDKDAVDVESDSPRLKRVRTGKRVTFRDDYGGLLVEVVGISDGADVCAEPGPIGVKEGSLVGKYESLVQVTVIPKSQQEKDKQNPPSSSTSSQNSLYGVTQSLKQYLNKVKSPVKGGLYGDLEGESLAEIKEGSWAETNRHDVDSAPSTSEDAHVSKDRDFVKAADGTSTIPADSKGDAGSSSRAPGIRSHMDKEEEDLFTESRTSNVQQLADGLSGTG